MPFTRNPVIALALPEWKPWGMTQFFNGINDHARQHQWKLASCPVMPESPEEIPLDLRRLKSWRVDGVIFQSDAATKVGILRDLKVPLVNIGEERDSNRDIPKVMHDNRRIGRMAAEFLIGLGFKNLAFHGVQGRWYSDERLIGFKEAGREAKLKVSSFCLPHALRDDFWNERYDLIKRWLKTLTLPVGIFGLYDHRALIVMSACQDLGLRVPDEVAVLGADNDLMVCEYSTPTLTSIHTSSYQHGLEAARLLERLMRGGSLPPKPILIEPIEVVTRGSTDVLHIDDPVVKKALQFMHGHYLERFGMEDLAEAVGASRRSLETHFYAVQKTTLAEYLLNLRIKKAKTLFANHPRRPTEEIARASGFGNGKNLRSGFGRSHQAIP